MHKMRKCNYQYLSKLISLVVKVNLSSSPTNKILVHFMDYFENFQPATQSVHNV